MNKILVIGCLGFLFFSCKAKKAVATKNPQVKHHQTKVILKNETVEASDTPVKIYANATERYIDFYKEVAKNEMRLYDIPASITLAQGILESASGNGRLSIQANNHFGIKCHKWTGPKIYHDDDEKQECFRKYKDPKYSYRDHSLFLRNRKRYSKLFELKIEDYKGWAKGLKNAGYATDPKYPQKLISLIERYHLYLFDQEKPQVLPKRSRTLDEAFVTLTVSKGDTLYAISKKYNISVETLKNINGLTSTTLSIGQVLRIKPTQNN